MRIHIIGGARNPSTTKMPMDPYSMVSYYLTTYLHRNGHEVHYYGYKESEVECTKKWECGDSTFLEQYYVTKPEKTHWVDSQDGNKIFFEKAREHLLSNCLDNDIIVGLKIPFTKKVVKSIVNKIIPSVGEKDFFEEIGFFKFIDTLIQ